MSAPKLKKLNLDIGTYQKQLRCIRNWMGTGGKYISTLFSGLHKTLKN